MKTLDKRGWNIEDPGPPLKKGSIPIYADIRSGRDTKGKMERDPYYNISADDQLEVYAEINSNASNSSLHGIRSDLSNIKPKIDSGGDIDEKIRRDPCISDDYQLEAYDETRSSVSSPCLYSIESYSSNMRSVVKCKLGNTRNSSIVRNEIMPVYTEVKKQEKKDVGFDVYENVEEFGPEEGIQCLEDPYYSSVDYLKLE